VRGQWGWSADAVVLKLGDGAGAFLWGEAGVKESERVSFLLYSQVIRTWACAWFRSPKLPSLLLRVRNITYVRGCGSDVGTKVTVAEC
jgi:hypothetical protein